MKREFGFDALVEYGVDPIDEELTRPNPERKKLEKRMKPLRKKLGSLEQRLLAYRDKLAEALRETGGSKAEKQKRKRWETKKAELETERRTLLRRLEGLSEQRKVLPKLVKAAEGLSRLKVRKKVLSDIFKMSAYQIETAMYKYLKAFYPQWVKDGRELLTALYRCSGALQVGENELLVTLEPLATPGWNRVVAQFCECLNEHSCCFPGTTHRMKYAVRGYEHCTN